MQAELKRTEVNWKLKINWHTLSKLRKPQTNNIEKVWSTSEQNKSADSWFNSHQIQESTVRHSIKLLENSFDSNYNQVVHWFS